VSKTRLKLGRDGSREDIQILEGDHLKISLRIECGDLLPIQTSQKLDDVVGLEVGDQLLQVFLMDTGTGDEQSETLQIAQFVCGADDSFQVLKRAEISPRFPA
jgi:hypothetical protein